MQISYFPDQISLAGSPIMEKFIETVRKTDAIKLNDMNCDAAVIWSVLWQGRMIKNQQVYNHYRDAGKPVIILETGNLIRGETFKVCINNINYNWDLKKKANKSCIFRSVVHVGLNNTRSKFYN